MSTFTNQPSVTTSSEPILVDVRDLKQHFPIRKGVLGRISDRVHAVDGVSFQIRRGETLSLVGESGCGKSTVGRCLLRLNKPTAGTVSFDGQRIDNLDNATLRPIRARIGAVFQDPFSSLNPRMRVKELIAEPIHNYGLAKDSADLDRRVAELLDIVHLPANAASRWPHEFSGGQRQRICIARALAGEPDLIVCDEAVSALDVSVKAQIVNLLQDLQARLGLALLFISHDLAIVEHLTHQVAVMYLGRIVEMGPKRQLFAAPQHPYTQALLSAVPIPDPDNSRQRIVLHGDVPSPINPPQGCHFHTRCPQAFARCRTDAPLLKKLGDRHWSACHLNEPASEEAA